MEHFDLEDMFGRRPKPILDITWSPVREGTRVHVVLALENRGRGPARAPYLAFDVPRICNLERGVDGDGQIGLPKMPGRHPRAIYGGGADVVIHSNTKREITSLTVEVAPERQPEPPAFLEIQAEIAALGCAALSKTIKIDWNDLVGAVYGAPNA
jgi:hypothetical protein